MKTGGSFMKAFVGIVLVFASFFQIDVMYTGQPLWLLWGNSEYIRYDSEAHVWMNHNPEIETLFRVLDLYDRVQKHTLPERVPEKKEVKITFNPRSWISENPMDAGFTTNSLGAIRQFLRHVGSVKLCNLEIPGVAVVPTGVNLSNERSVIQAQRAMQQQLRLQGVFDPHDVFVVPKLDLFSTEYWQKVWSNYRTIFSHKHINPAEVRNALALFAQGCTRTGTADVCSYCTIAGVADIRMPMTEYLKRLLETYQSFGINYVFNATDSVFEMRSVAIDLKSLGAFFPEGIMLYGRAWGLAHHPELIHEWLSLTGGRLLINVGMDSGDETILERGVMKASQFGSRLEENRQAIRNVAAA